MKMLLLKRRLTISNFVLFLAIFFSGQSFAIDRDPFSPTGGMVGKVQEMVQQGAAIAGNVADQQAAQTGANPLTTMQINGYKVIGVMTSDTQKLASVKTVNGVSYIMKVGDSLGSEGGKISDINIDGVVVQTESQEIKLPVSNRVEVQVDNAAK